MSLARLISRRRASSGLVVLWLDKVVNSVENQVRNDIIVLVTGRAWLVVTFVLVVKSLVTKTLGYLIELVSPSHCVLWWLVSFPSHVGCVAVVVYTFYCISLELLKNECSNRASIVPSMPGWLLVLIEGFQV